MGILLPLSEKELGELEDFLLAAPDKRMTISELDGFLTAIVCSPLLQLPTDWLPIVWGNDGKPEFESDKQLDRITELMLRHQNGIRLSLENGPGAFRPLVYKEERNGKTYWLLDDWCWGFMQCVRWQWDEWMILIDNENFNSSIIPIILLDGETEESKKLTKKPTTKETLTSMIPLCVDEIYAFWLEERNMRRAGIPEEIYNGSFILPVKKHGRNEPCPCGSGKKFKKCCGDPQKRH